MTKQLPEFKTEDEEREFWATHDSTEFIDLDVTRDTPFFLLLWHVLGFDGGFGIDWKQAQKVAFSNLKPFFKHEPN